MTLYYQRDLVVLLYTYGRTNCICVRIQVLYYHPEPRRPRRGQGNRCITQKKKNHAKKTSRKNFFVLLHMCSCTNYLCARIQAHTCCCGGLFRCTQPRSLAAIQPTTTPDMALTLQARMRTYADACGRMLTYADVC